MRPARIVNTTLVSTLDWGRAGVVAEASLRHALAALALPALACGTPPASSPAARPALYEKGPYQLLYGPDGRLLRLLYDGNGDGTADVVTLYGPDGKPTLAQVDTDLDGVVDRWEHFGPGGVLEKVGTSGHKTGRPDAWFYPDAAGAIRRRDFDDDRDGTVDRIETGPDAGPFREAQDTDGDGRPDRWLVLDGGRVAAEELDTDGDGKPDRRLVRDRAGKVAGVEVDPDQDGTWDRAAPARRGATP